MCNDHGIVGNHAVKSIHICLHLLISSLARVTPRFHITTYATLYLYS